MSNLYIMYGNEEINMVQSIMHKMNIVEKIKKLGLPNPLIGIKPNLVVAQPAEWGATTSPTLVTGVVKYLKNHGLHNIVIMESSWLGEDTNKAYRICGYEKIRDTYEVKLVNLKKDKVREIALHNVLFHICEQVLQVDYLINMPVLKAHSQTKLTCALKNLKGCIPDQEKRRFHLLGLHKPIAYLNQIIKPHLIIVDGIVGDLTHEEGGNPVRMDMVIAGHDPVLVDSYVAELIGYAAEEIEYIKIAAQLGVGQTAILPEKIIELNSKSEGKVSNNILASREGDFLAGWVVQSEACSPCYGSLIHALMRLKKQHKLQRLKKKIYIGQGFRNQDRPEVGIGSCTKMFKSSLAGCPPSAKTIVHFLEQYLDD